MKGCFSPSFEVLRRMFGYIRLFALASLAAVIVIAGLVGLYFRLQASQTLQAVALKENAAIARQFTHGIWDGRGVPAEPAARRFAEESGAAALRVYDNRGVLLFSTGGALPVQRFETEAARAPLSGIVDAADYAPDARGTWLRSFQPVGQAGYIELFTDVTPAWRKLAVLHWAASGSVLMVFAIMLWVLLILTRKAEIVIARQHEANTELAKAAASARAENEAKSQFLANISHELRTPLNAIIGFSEIIQGDLPDNFPARYAGYIVDIHSSGTHLLSLINDILDFSKAEAGKLEMEVEEMNAGKMIANCLRLVSPRAEAGNVRLVNALPKESLILETDSKKFKQIMLNLLSNAVKFTPSGGEVRVRAWVEPGGDALGFEIRDSGIGMAPKDIARALVAFEQVDSTLSRRYEGTGLGLPLTKKFIELMGGKMEMSSQPDRGTIVTFRLPRSFKPRSGAAEQNTD